MKILALGDSYTIGEDIPFSDNFPNQLADKIRQSGKSVSDVSIVAKTGWTTAELLEAIEKADLENAYDLVFLLIGVNNQYRGYPLGEYKDEFKSLLEIAIAKSANGKNGVYVLSIPDWGNTPFAEGRDKERIKNEINSFNAVNLNLSEVAQVSYIEITSLTRQSPLDESLIAPDGLHPSASMYAQWMDRIWSRLSK